MRELLCALALIALPASAATKISVAPFAGGSAAAPSRNQLIDALCAQADCVPHAKITTNWKPDWKKVKQARVSYVVVGKVKGNRLDVEVARPPGRSVFKKSYTLKGGKLPEPTLSSAVDAMAKAMKLEAREEAPEEVAQTEQKTEPEAEQVEREPVAEPDPEGEQAPASEPAEQPERKPKRERVAMADTIERERASEREREEAPVEVERRRGDDDVIVRRTERADAFLAVEVGPDLFSRKFAYHDVQTPNLRSYQASLIFAPKVKVELTPMAGQRGIAAGFGVEGSFAMAVGLKSRRSDGPSHPTSLTRLDLAAHLKIQPADDLPVTAVPHLGFRNSSFSVGADSDGNTLDGLPAISYSALVIGIGGEVPFGDTFVTFGRVSYLPVLSSGQIISDAYFPQGSASGIEGMLGLGFAVMDQLDVRLTGTLTRYGLSFKTDENSTYRAAGAVDQYLGVNFSVRYAL